jgi:hypothetical protein
MLFYSKAIKLYILFKSFAQKRKYLTFNRIDAISKTDVTIKMTVMEIAV